MDTHPASPKIMDLDNIKQAKLEGSMTGGQAQIDAERRIATDAHGRLESLLRNARTDECRTEIIDAFQAYMGAQALVSSE